MVNPENTAKVKEVFVAYPYTLFKKADYRRVYNNAGSEYGVKFVFADERITSMHILEQIQRHIKISDFSIFDISGWNPNVALELGVAYAAKAPWYICYNPSYNAQNEVPSNIRGLDRIEYRDFMDLEYRLSLLLDQWYPKQKNATLADHETKMRREVLDILRRNDNGLRAAEIAHMLGSNVKMVSVLIDSLVKDKKVKYQGETKARRYFLT